MSHCLQSLMQGLEKPHNAQLRCDCLLMLGSLIANLRLHCDESPAMPSFFEGMSFIRPSLPASSRPLASPRRAMEWWWPGTQSPVSPAPGMKLCLIPPACLTCGLEGHAMCCYSSAGGSGWLRVEGMRLKGPATTLWNAPYHPRQGIGGRCLIRASPAACSTHAWASWIFQCIFCKFYFKVGVTFLPSFL